MVNAAVAGYAGGDVTLLRHLCNVHHSISNIGLCYVIYLMLLNMLLRCILVELGCVLAFVMVYNNTSIPCGN